MHVALALLVLLVPATAQAADNEVRLLDIQTWGLILVVTGVAFAAGRSGVRWLESTLLPRLDAIRRAQLEPPRLAPWGASSAEGAGVLAGLSPGVPLHVAGADDARLVNLLREILAHPQAVVAAYGPQFERIAPPDGAPGRAFRALDEPDAAGLAALARRGAPVVLMLDAPPSTHLTQLCGRQGVSIVVVTRG